MKTEFLQNFKIGDQTLTKEVIDAILAENGRDIEAAKKPFADYETIKTQLAEAGKTIEGFKALDVDGIQRAADEWKAKAEKAEQDAAAKIAELEFNGLLTSAITGAKGKNAKAIAALLDLDTLRASKNQETDIHAALETLKKDSGYLFDGETQPKYQPKSGIAPVGYSREELGNMTDADYYAALAQKEKKE